MVKHERRSRSRSPASRDKRHRDDGEHRSSKHRHKEERHKHKHKDRRDDRDRRDRDDRDEPRRMKQEREDDGFREQQRSRQQNDDRRREARQRREQEGEDMNFAAGGENSGEPAADKEKPNFELSGKLTEDTNTYRGVVIKYNEPPEARKPKRRWRLYGFKGEEALPMLPIHRQSAYLLGRDRRVADIPVDHPSCSKQHAALQYRLVEYTRPDGRTGRRVRPYIIDLGSANGTYVNNQRIEAQRYVELLEKDMIKFGFSSREYVLLPENADTSEIPEGSDSD